MGQTWKGRQEDRGREGEEMKKRRFQVLKIACAQVQKYRNKNQRFRNQFNMSREEKSGDVARELLERVKSNGAFISQIKKFGLPTEDNGSAYEF